ncbi:Rieske 2Fe-2S domain-containing protein [Gordonia sp. LSe1-13]|uniref:Rieske-type oxygenase n=1 Tax=Gordonia sesuvii TaxID=3116777 RepID=A0ABU7M9B9_9ACTN|nr:Rieske 2Fe-2S domain-containing protein [Gordonia sp. LSe1-13]
MSVTSTAANEVRDIEAESNPTRFARGWHCLGPAKEFADGKPHAVEAFGTRLVVFADSKGDLKILDGYCRHLGGNLADGTVKGDTIACPFHGWEWGGNGRCKNIPYGRRVPPLAKTRSWTTTQLHGLLFVWHDPQGRPPIAEQDIPEIAEYSTGEFTDWTWNRLTITGSHCREIIDNVVDMAHFFYVHFAFPVYFKNVFEGHIAAQYSISKGRADISTGSFYDGDAEDWSDATYYGPSYMVNWHAPTQDQEPGMFLINCHYPVDSNSFVLQWGVIARKPSGFSDEEAAAMAEGASAAIGTGFLQDVEIWKNKAKIDNPLLCEEDGPVYQLRRWYQQFYVDVDDIADDMTNRFEFEIDTTRAVESWTREVADNVAAGRVYDAASLNPSSA